MDAVECNNVIIIFFLNIIYVGLLMPTKLSIFDRKKSNLPCLACTNMKEHSVLPRQISRKQQKNEEIMCQTPSEARSQFTY